LHSSCCFTPKGEKGQRTLCDLSYCVAKGGEIEVKAYLKRHSAAQFVRLINNRLIKKEQPTMGGFGKKGKDGKPVKSDAKSGKLPPKVSDDDDIEDGDIATPKRDRDDEQQDL
jgi:hypothetical protein